VTADRQVSRGPGDRRGSTELHVRPPAPSVEGSPHTPPDASSGRCHEEAVRENTQVRPCFPVSKTGCEAAGASTERHERQRALLLKAQHAASNGFSRGPGSLQPLGRHIMPLTTSLTAIMEPAMSSSTQRPAPTPRDLSGADAEDLALYREKFRGRLPESLDVLRGPRKGSWSCRCTSPGRG
jgi:hypothetical protein